MLSRCKPMPYTGRFRIKSIDACTPLELAPVHSSLVPVAKPWIQVEFGTVPASMRRNWAPGRDMLAVSVTPVRPVTPTVAGG